MAWTTCFVMIGLIVFLFFDGFYGGHKFRTMQDHISSAENVDLTGLREIKASGGPFPRFPHLSWQLRHVKEDIMILDVKSEFHGYVRGFPSCFLGYNRQKPGLRHIPRRLLLTGTTDIRHDMLTPEAEEAKKYGFDYKAVLVGIKFIATDEQIDEMVAFLDNLPKDVWLHVHCTHGAGRTSSTLAMLDILRNAPKVSLNDIVKRQHLLGSVDLFDTTVWTNGTYTTEELEKRKKFIVDFYAFVLQRKEGGIQKWSEWVAQQNDNKVALMSPLNPQ